MFAASCLFVCKVTQQEAGTVIVRGTELNCPSGHDRSWLKMHKWCRSWLVSSHFTVVMVARDTAPVPAFKFYIRAPKAPRNFDLKWLKCHFMCLPASEFCPLCVDPQVQTELRRWLQKCRNQNHLTPAKRSITQITSRAREGFGWPPSSANVSSVWL